MNYQRYKKSPVMNYRERTWVNKEISKAPLWCSVDLRDGNQALSVPMSVHEKIEMFRLLTDLGFQEIEVGFPTASQTEFDFIRQLINRGLVPDGVKLQVFTPCREDMIARTFDAIEGCRAVIVNIYNSVSTLQRAVVFHKNRRGITEIAVNGARWVKEKADGFPGEIILEYTAESYTGTELDFALDICNAVQQEWQPSRKNPMIINLPATVEMTTPNVYADGIEWMSKNLINRDGIILSVHPHNDRGTGVAAAELALLAGAERMEGTLFGNGERSGNVDLLTIAYNMLSQGVDPELRLERINEIIEIYERCCKIPVHPRHPYAGKLAFTTFNSDRQDAAVKGIAAMQEKGGQYWEVPYFTIDPADIGRK